MTSITVSTVAGLEAALASATQGETIELASGTYSGVTVSNLAAAGTVNITSLDPSNAAVISGLSVSGSSNIEFSNLKISAPLGANMNPNSVTGSSNITFSGDAFSGSTAATPANNNTGLYIGNSTGVHVQNSSFTQLQNGVVEANNNGVTVTGNTFQQLGGDGVDNSGSSNVTITGNSFTNFQNGNGIHPDAIQFWTTGTTASVSNITVSDNAMSRGTGSAFQGIFITDQVGDLSYINVTIANNSIVGGDYNGIELDHGVNATITGNTVVGLTDMQSWIKLYEDTGVTLTNNQAQDFVFENQTQSEITASGNGEPVVTSATTTTALYNVVSALAMTVETSAVSTSLVGSSVTALVLTGTDDLTVTANSLGDQIIANAGNDTIYSGVGSNTLTEGAGADKFVFGLGGGTSKDTITNFGANGLYDTIDLSAYINAGDHPTMKAVGANTVVTLDSAGDTLTLLGVSPSSLTWTSTGLSIGTPTTGSTSTPTAPTVKAETYTVHAGAVLSETAANGVLANDVDNNGLTLTAALATNGGPAHGTLVLNADGSFTYTPDLGFAGSDSFTYIAKDSLSSGTPTTVTLTVIDPPPTSAAETYAAHSGSTLTETAAQGVLANDTDNNGLKLTAALANNGGPAHGTLVLNSDGSFTYTANAGYVGTDSFTYIASDSLSSGAPTTVTLNVTATAPTVKANVYAATTGSTLNESAAQGVLANDVDNNGLTLTATLANNGGPSHGTLVLDANGSFTYTANAGYVGTDSFTYIASDGVSTSAPTTVTLNVGATAPTTTANSYTAAAGGVLTESLAKGVLANDTDNNGLPLSASLATNGGPAHGTVTLNADGSFTYTPNLGFVGTDSFTYVASDSLSGSAPTTVTINVAATAPTAKADSYAAVSGKVLTETAAQGVLANDVDNNGLKLTAALATNGGPAHGTLVLNADGSFTYTPTAGYVGTDSFIYVASDSLSSGAATTVTLNVAAGTTTAPVITGGKGNDTYNVSNSAEQINVAAGTPNETVIATVNYVLPANIQTLVMKGTGLTGTANSGTDTLTSLGGPNTLVAGSGLDTFNVNNINDKVVISASHNSDVINSTVNYTLPTNAHVLALSASGLTGVGNAAGYNYLISTKGGDTLVGSAKGHDTFIISHANDVIQVAATAVGDVVNTYASYTLPANVQKIVAEGANALTLVGNSAANTLVANKGADTLTGGGGADTFVMAPGEKMETITDFSTTGGDQIDISAYLAKGLNPTFHDFGTYSTVTFTTGETIKLLGVHASALHVSGEYIV